MSDTTPPTPDQPSQPAYTPPPAAGAPDQYSAPGAPGGYSPAAAPKRTLSLVGFIFGIAAFVLSFVFVLGLILSIVAIVTSFLGKAREPGAPKWMWIIGLVGGFIGLVVSLIITIIAIIGFVAIANDPSLQYQLNN